MHKLQFTEAILKSIRPLVKAAGKRVYSDAHITRKNYKSGVYYIFKVGDFLWAGSANSVFEARYRGWRKWLDEMHPNKKEDLANASSIRDSIFKLFLSSTGGKGTVVITKEYDLEAVVGNRRFLLLTRDERNNLNFDVIEKRLKKGLEGL